MAQATTPRTYAEDTTVPVSRSKAEIEDLVTKYGASKFATGSDSERGIYGVTFEIKTEQGPRQVRLVLQMPPNATDQKQRALWRALVLHTKSRLVAVKSGIVTFEQAFLSDLVLPNGITFSQWAAPQIAHAYETNVMPELLPGVTSPVRAIEGKK